MFYHVISMYGISPFKLNAMNLILFYYYCCLRNDFTLDQSASKQLTDFNRRVAEIVSNELLPRSLFSLFTVSYCTLLLAW